MFEIYFMYTKEKKKSSAAEQQKVQDCSNNVGWNSPFLAIGSHWKASDITLIMQYLAMKNNENGIKNC